MTPKNTVYISSELRELIPEYMQSMSEALNLIKNLVIEQKWDEIRREGHKMKGHGSAYGFTKISEIGIEIEKAVKSKSFQEISKLVQDIENYLANLDIQYRD